MIVQSVRLGLKIVPQVQHLIQCVISRAAAISRVGIRIHHQIRLGIIRADVHIRKRVQHHVRQLQITK